MKNGRPDSPSLRGKGPGDRSKPHHTWHYPCGFGLSVVRSQCRLLGGEQMHEQHRDVGGRHAGDARCLADRGWAKATELLLRFRA